MTRTVIEHLQQRLVSAGAAPLITYYDEASGERTELSATSFGNWVDKTANLLTDEVLIEPGQPVLLSLASQAPGHWVTLIWVAASWRAGCPVWISSTDGGPGTGTAPPAADTHQTAAVEVVGPAESDTSSVIERVACSLHPLGLGFTDPLPQGTLDYGLEVRGQPDRYTRPIPTPETSAWAESDFQLSQRQVAETYEGVPGERRVVLPRQGGRVWARVRDALVRPVMTGGSSVIILGADSDRIASIRSSERAEPAQRPLRQPNRE